MLNSTQADFIAPDEQSTSTDIEGRAPRLDQIRMGCGEKDVVEGNNFLGQMRDQIHPAFHVSCNASSHPRFLCPERAVLLPAGLSQIGESNAAIIGSVIENNQVKAF